MAITLNRNKFKYKNPSGSGYRNVDLLEEESKVNDVQVDGTSVVTSGVANIDLSGKADKVDTVLDTTLSRGRMPNSIIGRNSFAFGVGVEASGRSSQAVGDYTTASGITSHAEGMHTTASGTRSHAEGGYTEAKGFNSHTEGYGTIAESKTQHVQGKYNVSDSSDNYADIVGNGTADDARSNAYALDWEGNGKYAGDVYVGANADSSGGSKLARESIIAPAESATATSAHAIGDKFILDGQLCKATAAIAVGDTITTTGANANAEVTQVVDELGGAVNDVQVDGTSIVSNGVANIPYASADYAGVVKTNINNGVGISEGSLYIFQAYNEGIQKGTLGYRPICPQYQHQAAFYGLAKAAGADMANIVSPTVGVYPEAQKSAISSMLNAPETVSGTTPVIVANAGIQYVCGEVSTIDITPCATGVCDVVFRSGSTPAVLTMPNTVMFPSWFDPTSLDADTTYEINVLNGTLGAVMAWA